MGGRFKWSNTFCSVCNRHLWCILVGNKPVCIRCDKASGDTLSQAQTTTDSGSGSASVSDIGGQGDSNE